MAGAHQAPHHVGAHPAEADHSDLHVLPPSLDPRLHRRIACTDLL
jgi:hypothetical protein